MRSVGSIRDSNAKRTDAVPGDLRLLISVLDGKPVAVLYRWKTTGEKHPQTFTSPWRQYTVEDVQVLGDAKVTINRRASGYEQMLASYGSGDPAILWTLRVSPRLVPHPAFKEYACAGITLSASRNRCCCMNPNRCSFC